MDGVGEKRLQKSYFDVLGLCCSSEIPLIENVLKQLDGVKDISVIVATRTVIVVHDTVLVSQLQIVNALNGAKLEANVKVHGKIDHRKKWPSPHAVVCGVLLGLSFLKYVYHPLRWLALGAVAAGSFSIIRKALAAMRNLRIDINILMLVAVTGTIAMNDYVEAATIVFLFSISEWLESRASHKANAAMSSLMSIAPQKALLAETGEEVNVDEVKLNTLLSVRPGEAIPIDGVVIDGDSEVDEKTLTGESFPVPKHKDSSVLAGTINLNGHLTIKTTALAEDCAVARMTKLVEEAQNKKSRTQRFIDECAKYYTPAVLLISFGFVVVPMALHVHNLRQWLHLALVVLVSACPCSLVMSTPVVSFCALTKAAKSGLLIKGGDYLEILSKIKIMAFDKTGTITRGEFVVEDFQSLPGDLKLDTLLYWVSSIESKSSHPMAAPLVEYGRSFSIEPKPENVQDFQNFPGEGIYGKIDGQDIYIGNRKIALRSGCSTAPNSEISTKGGKSIGYVYSGAQLVGVFGISDACRTGASAAIKELKSLKIRTAMLTGDSWAAAQHAQNQLIENLDALHAELLPEDKLRIIQSLKTEGLTAMVGDGINDAPALATADVGISMGISGSALAVDSGHVILMSNDIRKIPKAIKLARRAWRKIIENVIMSIVTKAGILALGFAGHPLVWAAVLTDVGTCLLVILNSMLLLQEGHSHHHGGSCQRSPHVPKCSNTMKAGDENKGCCGTTEAVKVCKSQRCATKCQSSSCQAEKPIGKAKKCCASDIGKTCHGNKQEDVSKSASCKSSHPAVSSCGDKKLCRTTEQRGCSSGARTDQSSHHVKIQGVCESQDPPIRTCATKCQSNSCKAGKPMSKASKCCATDTRKSCHKNKLENISASSCCKSGQPATSSCRDEKLCSSTEQKGCSSHGKTDQSSHPVEIPEVCESPDLPCRTCAWKCQPSSCKVGKPINKAKICCPNDAGKPCCENKSEANSAPGNDHQHCTSKTNLQIVESACCNPSMSFNGDEEHFCSSKQKGCSCHGRPDQSSHHSEIHEAHAHGCSELITLDTCKNNLCSDLTKNCCNYQVDKISSGNGHCHEEDGEKSSSKKCVEDHHQLHNGLHCCTMIGSSAADIEMGRDHVESTCRHACASLAQREVGGCCKSYMKECCWERHGHLGPSHGFGGCLSEIVIE